MLTLFHRHCYLLNNVKPIAPNVLCAHHSSHILTSKKKNKKKNFTSIELSLSRGRVIYKISFDTFLYCIQSHLIFDY